MGDTFRSKQSKQSGKSAMTMNSKGTESSEWEVYRVLLKDKATHYSSKNTK
jgi:hypothetical protein